MMPAKKPEGISVLICTYNGAKRLVPTLEHLANQRINANVSWEIILVDNNSSDNTLEHSAAYWKEKGSSTPLRLLSQPKPGKQFALELAYNTAQYEFMCIVDDDNWLASDYLQNGYNIMKSDSLIGLLGGSNVGAFEIAPPAWFPAFQASYAVGKPVVYSEQGKQTMSTGEVSKGVLWGAGLFVRHDIWAKLQVLQFDSLFTGRQGAKQLTAGEDDELCYVAKILGYKVWYDESLVCTHYMTAGRLTEEYLKRLCHASPRAYPGLSAYRKALEENNKYNSLTPWVKDWIYMAVWLLRDFVSYKKVRAYMRGDLETVIYVDQRVLTFYNYTIRFNESRQSFAKVMNFCQRARQTFSGAAV
jgi:glycosyltransferase involved in cell wall biosynthesis